MNQLIQNYRNARRFLSECNSIAILNQYRGSALKQCARCRRELISEIMRVEINK
jgi:hypothetical protein